MPVEEYRDTLVPLLDQLEEGSARDKKTGLVLGDVFKRKERARPQCRNEMTEVLIINIGYNNPLYFDFDTRDDGSNSN
jgi:hypothetical protein